MEFTEFQFLPPVLGKTNYTDSAACFLLNTMTNSYEYNTKNKPWVNSIQIVDADAPWPPRWYAATPPVFYWHYEANNALEQRQFNFMIDAKTEAGYLSFFKLVSLLHDTGYIKLDVQGYMLLNEKMEPVDTVGTTTKHAHPYWHDFRINSKGERLMDIQVNTALDLRKTTHNPADSAIGSCIDVIQVLDSNNKIVFNWVTTDNLDPNVFQYEASLKTKPFARNKNSKEDLINWSHLTTAIWDYDDNILYALRFIGIGKINRQTGKLMWHIDYNDLPVISGNDTIRWHFPHDYKLLYDNGNSAVYSLYSLGDETFPQPCAVIFEQDKKTSQIKLIKYFYPKKNYRAIGQGSFQYLPGGEYVLSYGFYPYDSTDEGNFTDAFEYGKNDLLFNVYQMPRFIQTYRVLKLENWPRPPRPSIEYKNGKLFAVGSPTNYRWYKLEGEKFTEPRRAGEGNSITPEWGATYCVEAPYGMGYSVSRVFTVR